MNLVAFEWIAWRVFVVGACAAMFIRLQWNAKPIEPPTSIEAAFSDLVTPDELAAHKAKLLATVGEKSTRCARPVLRGEPMPGPALADQLAFDVKGPLTVCIKDWPLDQPPQTEPTIPQLEVIGRCAGPLEAAVRAAIGHAEGCSAYGLGGPEPSELGPTLFAGQVLGTRARELAKSEPPTALWMLLDLMRFGQDHARGHTDLMLSMLGTAIENAAVEHAHAILERGKPANVELPGLDKQATRDLIARTAKLEFKVVDDGSTPGVAGRGSQYDELATALDVLLASEPSFGEAAASDTPRVALDWGLAGLEPASWVPPGGKRSQQSPPVDRNDPQAYGRAVQLVVFGNLFPIKIARACPADASLAACFNGLSRPVAVIDSDGSPRSIVQQVLVETTIPLLLFTLRDYVVKRAQHHSDLISMRLRVEVMRHGCDRAALAKLATTPTLGDAVQLDYAPDAVTVRPPAWAASTMLAEPLTRRIACK